MPVDSTVSDLDDLFAASRAIRRRFEPDAYLNMAFYVGQQWTRWDGSQVFAILPEEWREMEVDNRIQPLVRTEIAKMTKTRPKWVAVPRTQQDDDIASARYGELALDDAWKRQNLLRKLRAALLWSRLTGAGFWKVWWDPTIGAKKDILVYGDGHPEAGRLVRDTRGGPLDPERAGDLPPEANAQRRSIAMGELCIELKSFFHLYPDPMAGEDGVESCEWIGEEGVYSRDYCAKHFPQLADKLTYDADPMPGALESRMPFGGLYDATTTQAGKGARLREYWSSDKHVVFVPGGQVLLEEPNRYPWLPYVMFRGVPVPGRFWPDSVVTHLRPRQVALNKRLSQISEHAERIANPGLLVPSSMGDDFDWQGLPGERIDYLDTGSPNAAPSFLQAPEMQATVQSDVERIQQSLMEISGQHEVTGASVPQGVTAASAISQLQEADDSRLGPDIADMEQAIADAGKRMLHIVRTYYTDERHLAVAGEGGRWDVMAFKGNIFGGIEDIEVQAGSAMPESKAAKQAAIQQVMTLLTQNPQNGMTPRDWRKVLGEFQIGGLEAFFSSIQRDEQQVEDENRRLALGEKLQINSYDNDEAHVWFHTDFQKTARYAALPDQVKVIMEEHVTAHRQRLAPPPPMAPPITAQPPGAPGPGFGPGAPSLGGAAPGGNGGPPAVPSGQ